MRLRHADDGSYYRRMGADSWIKRKIIRDFVLSIGDIGFVFDIGCNNGDMSHQFLKHGIKVLGVDISDSLQIPRGYAFVRCDITKSPSVIINDCTLFLSLYHHLVCDGLQDADDLFYKLLLRTNYLIFDCGNIQERGIHRQGWVNSLKEHFSTEKELLEHFAVRYMHIGAWNVGGASRTIIVFERQAFDQAVEIMDEFRRGIGAIQQKRGLTSIDAIGNWQDFYTWTIFYKLRLDTRFFFAKKHLNIKRQERELAKIVEVHNNFPEEQLVKFYGISDSFGLIYEWIDDFSYRGKARAVTLRGVHLSDADVIKVDGQLKVIDFA